MENSDKDFENSIVKTTWTDRDTEYVAQSEIYKMLGLKSVDELYID